MLIFCKSIPWYSIPNGIHITNISHHIRSKITSSQVISLELCFIRFVIKTKHVKYLTDFEYKTTPKQNFVHENSWKFVQTFVQDKKHPLNSIPHDEILIMKF